VTAHHRGIRFQIALTCTQIWWTTEVGLAFARLEEGYENSIKDYNKKQVRGPVCPCKTATRLLENSSFLRMKSMKLSSL
jgi:hypothetical protein